MHFLHRSAAKTKETFFGAGVEDVHRYEGANNNLDFIRKMVTTIKHLTSTNTVVS